MIVKGTVRVPSDTYRQFPKLNLGAMCEESKRVSISNYMSCGTSAPRWPSIAPAVSPALSLPDHGRFLPGLGSRSDTGIGAAGVLPGSTLPYPTAALAAARSIKESGRAL